ncbi:hypothetical protein VT85_02050 [Planctomyces sp. SH-PL62]|nr:hypothetical protein VT85_02050 [Planctomyces sp. SH-PL62]
MFVRLDLGAFGVANPEEWPRTRLDGEGLSFTL